MKYSNIKTPAHRVAILIRKDFYEEGSSHGELFFARFDYSQICFFHCKYTEQIKLIDANVILRYLLNDNVKMSAAAKEVIDSGAFTTAEVLAEVVYVLKGVYGLVEFELGQAVALSGECEPEQE